MNLITKDESLRKENISRLKKLRDEWPDYLNRNTRKDDNNQISLSCKALENKYYTHVSQSSEKGANNLGRGMTSPYIHIDEGPFVNHIETTIASAMGATNAAREIAKRKGYPYCNVFTTTAGNRESRDGKFIFEMMKDAAPWTEKFFDAKNREELVELIVTNSHSAAPMVNLTMSHRQLGLSDQWLMEAIANARTKDPATIDKDYFNLWPSSSGGSLIEPNIAKKIRTSEMEPVHQWISKENYIFRWYEEVDPNAHYVLVVDTSDAIGRDDIGVVLLNMYTGAVAGAAAFNETNLMRFAHWLKEFLVKYKNTTLAIERRYNAQVIIDILLVRLPEAGEDPFKRMFNQVVQNRHEREKDYLSVISTGINRPQQMYDKHRRDFGFVTDSERRKMLYSNVILNAAKDTCDRVRDKQLIGQVLNLEIRNGRIDHSSSGHDDMVIAWLIGHWFANHGMNLDHYGIKSVRVMSDKRQEVDERTPQEKMRAIEQETLKQKVDELHERLSGNLGQMEISRLERELEAAMSRLDYDDNEGMTLDALIQDAKTTRQRLYGTMGGGNAPGVRNGVAALMKRWG